MSEETTIMTDGGGDTGAPEAAVTPEATNLPTHLVGMDGKLSPGWHENLGMDVDKSLHNITDMQTLVKSWKDAQIHIGQQGGKIGDMQKQIELSGQVTKPVNSSDYSMTIKPDDVPDDAWDQESADYWANVFHENGVSDDAANDLTAKFAEQVAKNMESDQQKTLADKQANEADLKKEWGRDYDSNIEKAISTAAKLGVDVNDPDVGNNMGLVKAMAKISDGVSESVLQGLGVGNSAGISASNTGLHQQATDIIKNPNNPDYEAYNNPSHQNYTDTQLKVSQMLAEHVRITKGR